jgi:hypothetical protein
MAVWFSSPPPCQGRVPGRPHDHLLCGRTPVIQLAGLEAQADAELSAVDATTDAGLAGLEGTTDAGLA